MEQTKPSADGSAGRSLPTWAWLGGVVALFAWHGWLTLALFGDDPWTALCDDRPIVTAAHPQHLYLGWLGAQSVSLRGRALYFDIDFAAGFPNTPIFDGGRLAELFLLLGGGTYQPAAYKIGLATLCMLVPVFLLLACKTLELGHATALLATFLGQLVWWGPHGRAALAAGDCELYLASLAALGHVGFLIAFHRTTSVWSWFGLWMTGCAAWFLQPLLFPIALPVLLVYYLSVGVKHDFLTWHFAFWGAEMLAIALNLPWLVDWFDSWWLRTPLPAATDLLAHRTFATVWQAPIWGGSTNRFLALALLLAGTVGVVILNQTRQRPAARLLAITAGGALTLALLGISWEPLGAVGTSALFAPALWFACVPAAHGCVWTGERLWRQGKWGRATLGASIVTAGGCFVFLAETPHTLMQRCLPGAPLEIGLGPRREAVVAALLQHTDQYGRILWEDRKRSREASRWPALLPVLTGRSYIGGLDPEGFIEHSSIGLLNETLEHFPIAPSGDTAADNLILADYCRRYNVRWVVAWSPDAIARFERWDLAEKRAELVDEEPGWLFEIKRAPSYALRGSAELLESDGKRIRLANVVPRNGEVVLSLHYHAGMRASPGRVQVERATSGEDDIGFIRLRLAEPASRVTLSWDR